MATVNLGRIKPQWQGSWSSSTQYVTDDMVAYNNDSWIATTTSTNSAPSDGNSDWDLLARGVSAGSVTANEIADGTITAAKISDATITAAKLAPGAAVPDQSSASGQFLTSDGTNASWASLPPSNDASALTQGTLSAARLPAGTIQNIQHVTYDSPLTVTGSSYTTCMSCNITPSSSSSKVLVSFDFSGWMEGGGTFHLRIYRNGTAIALGTGRNPQDTVDGIDVGQPGDASSHTAMTYLDSPGTTSQVTYDIRIHGASGVCYMNRTGNDSSSTHDSRTISTMTLMEVLQ